MGWPEPPVESALAEAVAVTVSAGGGGPRPKTADAVRVGLEVLEDERGGEETAAVEEAETIEGRDEIEEGTARLFASVESLPAENDEHAALSALLRLCRLSGLQATRRQAPAKRPISDDELHWHPRSAGKQEMALTALLMHAV